MMLGYGCLQGTRLKKISKARAIAIAVSPDIRDCVKIGRLAKSKEQMNYDRKNCNIICFLV